jgi:hypothetical protein
MGKTLRIFFIAVSFVACNQQKESELTVPGGFYFGQPNPTDKLEIFAPEIVSTGLNEGYITFSPDGKECYWSILFSDFVTIVTSKLENGQWTKPKVAPFAGKYYDGWPAIQSDGKRMFFHSSRPVADTSVGITAKFNIWYMDRTEKGWSDPVVVNAPVNGRENSTCPSVTRSGNLYISKRFSDGSEKLCRSELRNGFYQELEILPVNVNVLKDNYHGYISPDESYFIRICNGRPDNIGSGWNYYITFRKSDGTWSDLVNLGKEVNSVYCGGAPSISPDGKYLFFQGIAATSIIDSLDRKYSLEELIDLDVKSPQKGSTDIYWVSAKIMEELRPK